MFLIPLLNIRQISLSCESLGFDPYEEASYSTFPPFNRSTTRASKIIKKNTQINSCICLRKKGCVVKVWGLIPSKKFPRVLPPF